MSAPRRAGRGPVTAIITCLLLAMLVGCGGGGGSSAPPPLQPTASFSANPDSGTAPLTVTFDGSDSRAAEGSLTGFAWDFGDGQSGSGSSVEHTYVEAGSFQARLTVTNSAGRSASTTRSIEVSPEPVTHRVSGTVVIGTASAADGTTNDPNAQTRPNDSLDSAQEVQLPISIGGYVAQPGAGPSGVVRDSGDPSDFYRFRADGGERIELLIGNPDLSAAGAARNDLDLFLYAADDQALIEGAVSSGASESLTVPEAGDYLLEVRAALGASTYALSIGGDGGLAAVSDLRISADFVPGELLLGSPDHDAVSSQTGPIAYQTVRRHGNTTLARLPRSRQPGRMGPAAVMPQHALARSRLPEAELRLATLEAIRQLRRSGRYTWVEPNYLREAQGLNPDDPLFVNQWHYRNIQLPLAWELSTGDADVIVAVLDSGVLLEHPDLQGQLLPGYDFIDDVPGGADPDDGSGAASHHGTHVAGTIAARTDNSLGVAGAGWDTRVLPLRILGRRGGSSADLLEALKYATGMDNRSGTTAEQPAQIINLSLGGGGRSEAEEALFRKLREEKGVFVVAAAGNRRSSAPFYPASYDSVIAVSATTIDNRLASYSNFGPHIDLAAPGGERAIDAEVISTTGRQITDGDSGETRMDFVYEGRAGTSMAAPHVSAVIALMKAIHPELTPELFDTLLAAGRLTDDLGEPGRDDRFGHGLINARKAVIAAMEAADGTLTLPAILTVSPTRLVFDPFTDELEVLVGNAGTETLTLDPPSVDVPWLSVAGSGLGSYRVSVDRNGLADGSYEGSILFEGDADNSVTVNVRLRVAAASVESDAGLHYVILADPDTGEILLQETVEAVDGRYPFSFDAVPAGDYELYAGTDMNNNFLVCDEAEACGLFPTMDAPEILTVDGDIDGIEFVTGFRAPRFDAEVQAAGSSTGRPAPATGRARPRLEESPP